jgi:hypothetical protein
LFGGENEMDDDVAAGLGHDSFALSGPVLLRLRRAAKRRKNAAQGEGARFLRLHPGSGEDVTSPGGAKEDKAAGKCTGPRRRYFLSPLRGLVDWLVYPG